jgi:hypothetical protein
MNKKISRVLATAAATGVVLAGAAGAAQADTFSQVGVGQERCLAKFANYVSVYGISSPYAARFQVKRSGVVLYQATSSAVAATFVGAGYYEFCGKNKLGNPGPIDLYLQIS